MNSSPANISATNVTRHNYTPSYGARLLPQVLDEIARTNSAQVYASIPKSTEISDGFRDLTFRDIAQATDFMAWWLHDRFGYAPDPNLDPTTLAFMGTSDLRYVVLLLASIKCGYQMLLLSLRNSAPINSELLQETGCTKLLYTQELFKQIEDLKTQSGDVECTSIPTFEDVFRSGSKHYHYDRTYADIKDRPVLILCSSGSTRRPKPVYITHGALAAYDNDRNLPTVKGRKNQSFALYDFENGGRYFSAFPPFHLGGLISNIIIPIFYQATLVVAPSSRPPSGLIVHQIMKYYRLHALFCPPIVFEQLVHEPEGVEHCSGLNFIMYAGGPLSQRTGELLSGATDVLSLYGATETGPIQALVPFREDWAYLEIHPAYKADMQHDGTGSYELVLHKFPGLEKFSAFPHTYPDLAEWRTKDLFLPHPTKPDLWKFYGRTDDAIVLSNGEKFNPVPMEGIIQSYSLVSGALIVGNSRSQPALFVELKSHEKESENILNELWPIIEHANQIGPSHGRITRSKVLLTTPEKPMVRAGKGTIIRKQTAALFEPEIEDLFSKQVIGHTEVARSLVPPYDLKASLHFVRVCVTSSAPKLDIGEKDDLFVRGMDSLQTAELAEMLRAGLIRHSKILDLAWVSSRIVYENPTMLALAQIVSRVMRNEVPNKQDHYPSLNERITSTIEKYTYDLPHRSTRARGPLKSSEIRVILTGSTGQLGMYLLPALLDDPSVSHVYCLNRSNTAAQRTWASFSQRGLSHHINSHKVTFLHVSFGAPNFALSSQDYSTLLNNTDAIIHNAWQVDFNISLSSFEAVHIRGVRNFIDFCIASPNNPRLIFISSISSVTPTTATTISVSQPVQNGTHFIPESPLPTYTAPYIFGYGESKFVSERILSYASHHASISLTTLRIGQIAGSSVPPKSSISEWTENEWFPQLVRTSASIRKLPDRLPEMDWITIDALAIILREVLHFEVSKSTYSADRDAERTYNIVSPERADWSSMLPLLLQHLPSDTQVVPLSEWISTLETFARMDDTIGHGERRERGLTSLEKVPALKILDFYRGFVRERDRMVPEGLTYETRRGREASQTMDGLRPLGGEWMEKWVGVWFEGKK